MKKKLLLALLLTFTLVFTTACGGGGGEDVNDGEGSAQAGDVTIKFAHVEAEDSPCHQAIVKFQEAVEAESNGNVKVEIFPNGELGSERQILEGLNLGTIHMAVVSVANFEQYDEKFSTLSLPFLFESQENMEAAFTGEFGQMGIDWMAEYGFYGLGYHFDGSRNMSNSKRAINSVADMNGLKMRVMESPLYINMFTLMGANPTPMSFTEVYTALQQGVVDGQDNPPALTYTSKFHEVQDFYSLTQHVFAQSAGVANPDFMDSLTDEQKEVVLSCADEWLIKWQRDFASSEEAGYIQKIKDEGTAVNEITPENHQGFVDAVQPIYDEYREKLGDEVMDKVLDLAN